MAISCNWFWCNFKIGAVWLPGYYGNEHLDRKIHLKFLFHDHSTNHAN